MKNEKLIRVIQHLTVILIFIYNLASTYAQTGQPVRIKAYIISNGTQTHQSTVNFRAMSVVGQNISSSRLEGTEYDWVSGSIGFLHGPVTDITHRPDLPIPVVNHLYQNYPNPFNPETIIQFDVSKESEISLTIHNVLGQKVKSLVREKKPVGVYSISWNGLDNHGQKVESGLYFIILKTGESVETRKMIFAD